MDKWFNVNVDSRVRAGHGEAQKQGWIRAPAAIRAIDEYKGSYQFKEWKIVGDGQADFVAREGYPQFWIRIVDVTTEPYEQPTNGGPGPAPDPVPNPVPVPTPDTGTDAELGKAFRLIGRFLADRIHEALG